MQKENVRHAINLTNETEETSLLAYKSFKFTKAESDVGNSPVSWFEDNILWFNQQ